MARPKAMVDETSKREQDNYLEEVLALDEAFEKYPNQWILMNVIERDEFRGPEKGQILAHGNKDVVLIRRQQEDLAAQSASPKDLEVIETIQDIRTGDEFRRWLNDAIETGRFDKWDPCLRFARLPGHK